MPVNALRGLHIDDGHFLQLQVITDHRHQLHTMRHLLCVIATLCIFLSQCRRDLNTWKKKQLIRGRGSVCSSGRGLEVL